MCSLYFLSINIFVCVFSPVSLSPTTASKQDRLTREFLIFSRHEEHVTYPLTEKETVFLPLSSTTPFRTPVVLLILYSFYYIISIITDDIFPSSQISSHLPRLPPKFLSRQDAPRHKPGEAPYGHPCPKFPPYVHCPSRADQPLHHPLLASGPDCITKPLPNRPPSSTPFDRRSEVYL